MINFIRNTTRTIVDGFKLFFAELAETMRRSEETNIQTESNKSMVTCSKSTAAQNAPMRRQLSPYEKNLLRQSMYDVLQNLPAYLGLSTPLASLRVTLREEFIVFRIPLSPTNSIAPASYPSMIADFNTTSENIVWDTLDRLRNRIKDDAYTWHNESSQHWNSVNYQAWANCAAVSYLQSYQILYGGCRKNLVKLNVTQVEVQGNTLLVYCLPYFTPSYRPDFYWNLIGYSLNGYDI